MPAELLAPVDAMLDVCSHLWLAEDHAKPNHFPAFAGSTLHIVFQYPKDLRSHLHSDRFPLWDEWRHVLEPVIAHATAGYGYADGRTTRVMLARLLRRQTIARHVDRSPSARVPHKIHVPITTNDAVRFVIGNGTYELARSRAYEVNNRRPHAVHNHGSSDRVHLVFDYFDAAASHASGAEAAPGND